MPKSNPYRCVIIAACLAVVLAACAGTQTPNSTEPMSTEPTDTAESAAPTDTPAAAAEDAVARVAGEITWLRSANPYGHTGIKLETAGKVIYLDPVDLAGIETLPKADLILVTHLHEDHFSPATITALSKEGTVVASIQTVGYSLTGVEFVALAPGETAEAGGLQVEAVSAYNDSHPKEMGWLGFLFSVEGVRIYCSGDTGLTPEMEALGGIDIAVLNVRNPYSLTGREVVEFAKLVKPKIVIPIHWMPENDGFGDKAEIDYIRENMPADTEFLVLDLSP
jgi:L-ascorbate metabolism protein UlaG (beta-lactamase superfamily)